MNLPLLAAHKPVREVLDRLTLLTEARAGMLERIAKRYGLNESEAAALAALSEAGAMTASALAARCRMNKTRISRVTRSLERQGLVTCERNSLDHRSVRVALTTRGAAIGQSVLSAFMYVEGRLQDALATLKGADALHLFDEIARRMKTITSEALCLPLSKTAN